MEKLNLGCGKDYKKGWVNVDINKNWKADIFHDLNRTPYPFKDDYFSEILLKMILEHLENPDKILKEIVRISKQNAKLIIIVPHSMSYTQFTDLQHKNFFTENTFSKELLNAYNLNELILIKQIFIYDNKWKKFIPFKKYLKIFFTGIYDDLLFEFKINKKI